MLKNTEIIIHNKYAYIMQKELSTLFTWLIYKVHDDLKSLVKLNKKLISQHIFTNNFNRKNETMFWKDFLLLKVKKENACISFLHYQQNLQ